MVLGNVFNHDFVEINEPIYSNIKFLPEYNRML